MTLKYCNFTEIPGGIYPKGKRSAKMSSLFSLIISLTGDGVDIIFLKFLCLQRIKKANVPLGHIPTLSSLVSLRTETANISGGEMYKRKKEEVKLKLFNPEFELEVSL